MPTSLSYWQLLKHLSDSHKTKLSFPLSLKLNLSLPENGFRTQNLLGARTVLNSDLKLLAVGSMSVPTMLYSSSTYSLPPYGFVNGAPRRKYTHHRGDIMFAPKADTKPKSCENSRVTLWREAETVLEFGISEHGMVPFWSKKGIISAGCTGNWPYDN